MYTGVDPSLGGPEAYMLWGNLKRNVQNYQYRVQYKSMSVSRMREENTRNKKVLNPDECHAGMYVHAQSL